MSRENWPVNESELERLNESLSMIKTAAERQEGLASLEHFPMTLPLLMRSGAGKKICRVFKSSRFYDVAHKTHTKWLQSADEELQKNWDKLKDKFLDKKQLAELDKAQTKYEKGLYFEGYFICLAQAVKKPINNEGLLQIAPSTSQQSKASTSRPALLKTASVPSYYNYDRPTPYSSVTGPGSSFSKRNDRKRGRPKGARAEDDADAKAYAPTSAPVSELAQSSRSSGRKSRVPTRFLD